MVQERVYSRMQPVLTDRKKQESETLRLLFWLGRLFIAGIFFYVAPTPSLEPFSVTLIGAYLLLDFAALYRRFFDNFAYALFLLTYPFFLLNALVIEVLTNGESSLALYPDSIRLHVLVTLMIGLLAVDFGYSVFRRTHPHPLAHHTPRTELYRETRLTVERVATVMFFLLLPISVYGHLSKVSFVQALGYLALYTSYTPPIPVVFGLSDIAVTALFAIFLASRPEKSRVVLVSAIYLSTQALGLGYGQRNPLLIAAVLVVFYFGVRERESGGIGRWISKKAVVAALLLLPFLLSFLYVFSFDRFDREMGDISTAQGAVGILEQQGGSVHVLALGALHRDELAVWGPYVFTPVERIVTGNPLARALLDIPAFSAKSPEYAMNSGSFGEALTFSASPATYFHGGGFGSSYLAELYQDYGYLGVVFGSILIGFVLSRSRAFGPRLVPLLAALLVLPAIWYSPRSSFLDFIYDALNPGTMAAILGVWLMASPRLIGLARMNSPASEARAGVSLGVADVHRTPT